MGTKLELKKKLLSLRKNLSVQHLSRDIIGLQLLLVVSIVIASLLFLWIVSAATSSSEPMQVMQTAEKTSGYMGWFFFIAMNLLVGLIGSKARKEARKDEAYILETYGGKTE